MEDSRRIRVLLNHSSGRGGVSPEDICARFADDACQCDVTLLRKDLDLGALARTDAANVVWIAAGGDGTVNCVAHAVAGTGRSMGVLPAGTLNHFAQDLSIPTVIDEAITLAATGPIREIDAAEVNGKTFVNNSSLGVYPAMALDRDRMRRGGANKWWSLVVASARAFLRFRCLQVELEVDGQVLRRTTPLLFVGNNTYEIDGGKIGCRRRMDAGLLSVYLVPDQTRLGMLQLFAASLFGRARDAGKLEEFVVSGLVVNAAVRRLRVSLDGEVQRMAPPLRYRSRPRALHVIAPLQAVE